jgi:serine/threonine-protein kinase
MEYVDGHDLDWMLQSKHQFKRAEVLNILQQTCDALDFAHKKQVIHQDLKSTNILLTPDLHVKITDFGIAGLDEIAAAQTKKLLSIPFYIAPEQALGEKVTTLSDLFSLGVIMYQILSGQLPFPGTSAANVIMMIARDNPALPKHLDKSGIRPEDWNSFFSVALAKSPGQRFKTANEMFSALQKILPSSDTTYFPYHVDGGAADSTGKFEKTYVGESPTMLIDPSKMFDETTAPKDEDVDAAPATISIPIPGAPEPKPSELTIAYNAQSESAYELLQASTPEPAKTGTIHPSEAGATMIVDSQPATTLPPQQSFNSQVDESSPMAPTQMIPIPQLPKVESFDKPAYQTQSRSPIPPPIPPPPIPPEPPKQQTIPPVNRPAPPPPPPPAPPTPPPQRYETYEPPALEEAELEDSEMPATQMFSTPEPVIPATQMISMPVAAPPKNPPTPAPIPTPIPKAPPVESQSVPESPYSLPSSPKPAGAVAPPGAKSALKMYWIAAIAVALIIIVAGLIFLLPKIMGPEKKVEVTPQPKPPVVEPPPKPPVVEPPPAATTGKIVINSEPVGAKILLNEEDKGVTPAELPDVAFGKYILKLQSKGYQDYQQEVEITAESPELTIGPITLEKSVATTGTLFVDSNPAGAYIFIQNKALGVTPKTLSNQKPGDVEVTLRKDGYRDFSGTAKITAGKKATLTATLQEIPKVVETPPEPPKPVAPQVTPGALVNLSDPDVVRPKTVKRVPAKYPEIAKKQKVEGAVMMNVLITETGKIGDVKVVSSASPLLDQAAIDAVRQWVFEPATKKGVKVKVWLPIQLSFKYR